MDSKICTKCNPEKLISNYYNKYTECKVWKKKGGLNWYYANKEKKSKQQKLFYEKNKEKILQQQKDENVNFKEIVRFYC